MIKNNRGVTLIELLIVIVIVGIIALITAPQIARFSSNYNVRSCATDLIQDMRVARAMAIKEGRAYLIVFQVAGTPDITVNPQGRYLIGFDFDGDNNLTTVSGHDGGNNNGDTFGICKDADGDRIPDGDTDTNADGVPDCVRVVNLNDCGNDIVFGYTTGTKPPKGPNDTTIPDSGITFSGSPPFAQFNPGGSTNPGSAYFQQTSRGYSFCVRISTNSGQTNMWKWDGDKDNPLEIDWTEIR